MASGPSTPPPPTFILVSGGDSFAELDLSVQKEIQSAIDDLIRPALLQLGVGLAAASSVLRESRLGLREKVESLADGSVIPMSSKAGKFKGARPLNREDVLSILDNLEAARRAQFGDRQQDVIAKACGPNFDRGG